MSSQSASFLPSHPLLSKVESIKVSDACAKFLDDLSKDYLERCSVLNLSSSTIPVLFLDNLLQPKLSSPPTSTKTSVVRFYEHNGKDLVVKTYRSHIDNDDVQNEICTLLLVEFQSSLVGFPRFYSLVLEPGAARPSIATLRVVGEQLKDFVARKDLTDEIKVRVVESYATQMEYLHQFRIYHQDLHYGNVFVIMNESKEKFHVKFIDFSEADFSIYDSDELAEEPQVTKDLNFFRSLVVDLFPNFLTNPVALPAVIRKLKDEIYGKPKKTFTDVVNLLEVCSPRPVSIIIDGIHHVVVADFSKRIAVLHATVIDSKGKRIPILHQLRLDSKQEDSYAWGNQLLRYGRCLIHVRGIVYFEPNNGIQPNQCIVISSADLEIDSTKARDEKKDGHTQDL